MAVASPKKPRREYRALEHQEQVALFQRIEASVSKHPALSNIFAIPNGGHRHPVVAANLKQEGVRAGVPDIFVAWTTNAGGWDTTPGLFIELKIPSRRNERNGGLSDEQMAWRVRLITAGYEVEVCYGWVEAWNLIVDYLRLPQEEKVS